MITCPDCGQTAPDEARFCEQCGRGLHDLPLPAVALPPLPIGKELQGRFRIVEVINQSSQENRYRTVALDNQAARFILRERIAPASQSRPLPEAPAESATARANPDPSGPLAKTRDLAPLAGAATAHQETPPASPAVATEPAAAALQDVQAEADPAHAPSAAPNRHPPHT